jgi:hypothetical protein
MSFAIFFILLFAPFTTRFVVNHVSFVYMLSLFGYSLAGNLLTVVISGIFKNYWAFIVMSLGTL